MTQNKKLIEVALPLVAINTASAYEKMPGIGPHPRGLHLWWARRPLAAARAVIFAQMVDDPSAYVDTLRADPKLKRKAETELKARLKLWEEAKALAEKAKGTNLSVPEPGSAPTLDEMLADAERQRLFRIIEDLVLWKNTTDETVLQAARDEIWASWRRACAENAGHPRAKELFDRHKLPAFHDPFAGGGALPLEAQRLGLEAKAGRMGARLMAIVAEGDRGRVYLSPTPEMEAIALSAKPVDAPETDLPAKALGFRVQEYGMTKWRDLFTPRQLVALTTFSDLVQEARERVKRDALAAATASPQRGEDGRGAEDKRGAKGKWRPPPVPAALLQAARELRKTMTDAERLLWQCLRGKQLNGFKFRKQHPVDRFVLNFYCASRKLAIELDGGQHDTDTARVKDRARTDWLRGQGIRVLRFWNNDVLDNTPGIMQTIWDALHETMPPPDLASSPPPGLASPPPPDLASSPPPLPSPAGGGGDDDKPLNEGGAGATAYSDAVAMYLAFGVDRCADFSNSCTRWVPGNQKVMNLFGKQAIAMTWDFPETAILHRTVGGFVPAIEFIAECIGKLPQQGRGEGVQQDAMTSALASARVVSSDPPYYDNIGYADLSDFFYVWLRRSLKPVFPDLFATLAVPKAEELVATPYRHGSKEKAEAFFLNGMTRAMHRLAGQAHPAFPVTIYYAFKQSETDDEEGTSSTGWDTFLDAVIRAGFALTGTWPIRSEQEYRMIGIGTNALASSIILVCRRRDENAPTDAPTATRRDFQAALKAELPVALAHLQRGNIAPVDLAQAAIGPGMAVYTRYAKVLDAEGKPVTVRDALALINQTLDEALAEQEGDFDSDSRWALAWFEQSGFAEGAYGAAETLSTAKNTSVSGLVEAGFLASKAGKVRLLKPNELPMDWDPAKDTRLMVWEMVHHLIRALEGGELVAAQLVAKLGAKAEIARELAYRLYALSERKKRAPEALAYNGLVQSWPEIVRLAAEAGRPKPAKEELLL